MEGRQAVGWVPKVSQDYLDHPDSKEIEDHQVQQALQELQEFQPLVEVVSPDLQASLEKEGRKETQGLQVCPFLVLQVVQELPVLRVNQDYPDLLAFLQQDRTVSLESLAVLVCREKEVTQERQDRKVRRATPA